MPSVQIKDVPEETHHDASYVALAELLDVPLVTADIRLARTSGTRCDIEVLTG